MNEIKEVPEPFLRDVLDFVHFIRAKTARENRDITAMSESSLGKE